MRSGIGIGLLSSAKNKKIVTIAGAVLMAVGVAGMLAVGSQILNILTERGTFGNPEVARSFFYGEYVFLFMIVGGLILLAFGVVSMQRKQ